MTEPTHEYIVAAETYAESSRNWPNVHFAWSKGKATNEEDREAYARREAAFERAEAQLKTPTDERELDQARKDYACNHETLGTGSDDGFGGVCP
jgi:hypothetical protein